MLLGEKRNACRLLIGNVKKTEHLEEPGKCEDIIKLDLQETGWDSDHRIICLVLVPCGRLL
jgi:hypothetical protein